MKVWECKCGAVFAGPDHGGMANIEHARETGGKNEDHPLVERKGACLCCLGRGTEACGDGVRRVCGECHGTGRKR